MKIKPVRNLIIFKVPEKEKTKSGILLATVEVPFLDKNQGIVEEVGPDVVDVKVGDKILVDVYNSTLIDESEKQYVCDEQAVYGVIESE